MAGTLIGPFGRYDLGAEIVTIGRARANKIVVDATQASGRHAEVRPERDGYVLVDLGSTNGTKLNGLKIPAQNPQPLRNGDVITIGGMEISFELAAAGSAYAPTERGAFPPPPAALPPVGQGAFPPTPTPGAYEPTQRAVAPPASGAYPVVQPIEPPPPSFPPSPQGQFNSYGGVNPVGPASYYPDTPPPPPPPPYTPPTVYGGAAVGGAPLQAPPSFPPPPPGAAPSPFGLPPPGAPAASFGAPPPPFVVPPAQPGPKRKPIALFAGIIVAVLLIGGIIGVLLVTHGKGGSSGGNTATPTVVPTATPVPGPEDIARAFYTDFEHQDYSSAYQLLASSLQGQLSEQTFTRILTCTDNSFGVVRSFTTALTSKNTTQAVVTVHVIRPQITYDDAVPLSMEHGSWRITDFSSSKACQQQG